MIQTYSLNIPWHSSEDT